MPIKKEKKILKDVKLLLVEDDDFLAQILQTKLTDDGGALTVCANATEALRSIEQSTPDLVITDLMLPGVSGEELIDKITSDERFKTVPIVVFSNKNNPAEIKSLLAKGIVGYHVKSETSLKDIPKIIQKALEK